MAKKIVPQEPCLLHLDDPDACDCNDRPKKQRRPAGGEPDGQDPVG